MNESKHFLLKLSTEEKRKLKIIAAKKNTTVTSLIRHLMYNNKTIEDL